MIFTKIRIKSNLSNTGLKVKNIKYKRDIIITEVNNTLNP